MRLMFISLSLFMSLASCRSDQNSNLKITGGETVRSTAHPAAEAIARATVKLILNSAGTTTCSGTLITKRLILTAAHCVRGDFNDIPVEFGYRTSKSGIVQGVNSLGEEGADNIRRHKNYDDRSYVVLNDIAVLRLAEDAPDESVPVSIINSEAELNAAKIHDDKVVARGQNVVVAGFGRDGANGMQDFKQTEMELIYVDEHGGRLVLADDDSSPCRGDSGGPIYVYQNDALTLVGVISMASCGAEWEIEIDGVKKKIKYNSSTVTDLRKFQNWLNKQISATELRQIKFGPVKYEPATNFGLDRITPVLIENFKYDAKGGQ